MAVVAAAWCLLVQTDPTEPDVRFSASVSYWYGRPRGRSAVDEVFGVDPPGPERDAPHLSLERDAEIDVRDAVIEAELRVVSSKFHPGLVMGPRLVYADGRFRSRGSLDEPEGLGVVGVPAGTAFSSTYLFRSLDLGWVVAPDGPEAEAEGRAGLRWLQGKLDWELSSGSVDADGGALGITVGGTWRRRLGAFWGELAADVLLPGFGGAWATDVKAAVGYGIGPMRFKAGYRRIWADEKVDDSFRLALEGLWAGLEVETAF